MVLNNAHLFLNSHLPTQSQRCVFLSLSSREVGNASLTEPNSSGARHSLSLARLSFRANLFQH